MHALQVKRPLVRIKLINLKKNKLFFPKDHCMNGMVTLADFVCCSASSDFPRCPNRALFFHGYST